MGRPARTDACTPLRRRPGGGHAEEESRRRSAGTLAHRTRMAYPPPPADSCQPDVDCVGRSRLRSGDGGGAGRWQRAGAEPGVVKRPVRAAAGPAVRLAVPTALLAGALGRPRPRSFRKACVALLVAFWVAVYARYRTKGRTRTAAEFDLLRTAN